MKKKYFKLVEWYARLYFFNLVLVKALRFGKWGTTIHKGERGTYGRGENISLEKRETNY